jgi:hypothetical protein
MNVSLRYLLTPRPTRPARALSAAAIITVLAYYAVILFHRLDLVAALVRSGIPLFVIYPLLMLPALGAKMGVVLWDRGSRAVLNPRGFLLLSSGFALVFVASILAVVWIVHRVPRWLSDSYWGVHHWVWTGVTLAALLAYVGVALYRYARIDWQLLDDLKAIPIVSPVFCFGAPSLWARTDSFGALTGLSPATVRTYSVLAYASGVVFLVYLVCYAIMRPRPASETYASPILVDQTGQPARNTVSNTERQASVCLLIFAAALYLFLLAIVDSLALGTFALGARAS